jgi:predicted nucleic acid-binding protein
VPIVIDANIAIGWFRAPASGIVDAALDAVCEHGAVVPALWRWEVGDVLRRLQHAGLLEISPDVAMREMSQLPITIDDQFLGLFGNEIALSTQHALSVYDAAYLELAVRRGVALATLDKKLAAAATSAGVAFVAS